VARGLSDLGNAATPTRLHKHIKDTYGLTMTLKHISTAKAKIVKVAGQGKSAAAKPPGKPPAAQKPAVRKEEVEMPAILRAKASQGISLQDIGKVKDLLERVGATSMRKLIDVMAR
jgi:hypothetical protein